MNKKNSKKLKTKFQINSKFKLKDSTFFFLILLFKTIVMSSRRNFLQNTSALAAGGLVFSSFNNETFTILRNGLAPSDQINIAAIGINGMGFADLSAILKHDGVNLVALCDVDKNVLDKRMADLSKMNIDISKIKTFSDYRKVLDLKDVNAVLIGTPDHWHCKIMVDACMAGKDLQAAWMSPR